MKKAYSMAGMKKTVFAGTGIAAAWLAAVFLFAAETISASAAAGIEEGIYAGNLELSGLNEASASEEIRRFVDSLSSASYTFSIGEHKEQVTGAQLGLYWANPELVSEAASLGKAGNLVVRFKALKDLSRSPKVYDIALGFDEAKAKTLLAGYKEKYDQKAEDATITRTEAGVFEMSGGNSGVELNIDGSLENIRAFVQNIADGSGEHECALDAEIVAPRGNPDDLARIKDVLGTFSTSYSSSSRDRAANVANGCRLINGHTVFPGETLSVLDCITPFSTENGYFLAGSYLNGQVVESLGGGICQVSTTLYNAVLLSELEVVERHNHSMIVSYVKPSMDAAIAESSGKDFKFRNNTDVPVYIEGRTADRTITFTIYGEETRDTANRKVSYESETLEKIDPGNPVISTSSAPIGTVSSQSAHIGYKAKLWKVVTENGQSTREEVNSSYYKATPRMVTFGTATADPAIAAAMQAALATGDVDHIKGVAAALSAQEQANQAAAAQAMQDALAAQAAAEAAAAQQAAPVPEVTAPETPAQ